MRLSRLQAVLSVAFYKPMAELMDMLRRRQVDFVLAFKPSETMEGIESHVLFQNYLAAIANPSHPIAGLPKVRIEDVARYSLALPSKGLQARNALDTLLERNPCELKIRIASTKSTWRRRSISMSSAMGL